MTISEHDYARLAPHLSAWRNLNEMFVLNELNVQDVRTLLAIELLTKARKPIVRKLVARLFSMLRNELLSNLEPLWQQDLKSTLSKGSRSGVKKTASSSTSSPVPQDVACLTALPFLQEEVLVFWNSSAKAGSRRTSRSRKS